MAAFDREGKNIARSAEDPERDRKAGAEIMFMEKRQKRDDKAVEEAEEEANRAASRRVNEVSIFGKKELIVSKPKETSCVPGTPLVASKG